MGMIKHQNVKKQVKLKKQTEKAKEGDQSTNSKKVGRQDDTDLIPTQDEEDNLITYREFINAIKALKSLYKRILPRTLSFRDVLICQKGESQYQLSDTNIDDFAMFRYEINSIFKLHQFKEETPSDLFMGRNPLSRTKMGKQIRDLDEKEKDKNHIIDMYRPPGLVRLKPDYYGDNKNMNIDPTEKTMEDLKFGNTQPE